MTPVFLRISFLLSTRAKVENCPELGQPGWVLTDCSLPVGPKVDILPAEVLGMLVQPSVFKTDVGREKRLGGVRFPCISAIDIFRLWGISPFGFHFASLSSNP